MTCLFPSCVHGSVYLHSCGGGGKKVIAIMCRSPSRGLGTSEVKIASVPVPAFTGN